MISKAWSLVKDDLKKVGIGLLLALGGALIAFLGDLSTVVDYSKYGEYGPLVALGIASVSSSIINLVRKWMTRTEY